MRTIAVLAGWMLLAGALLAPVGGPAPSAGQPCEPPPACPPRRQVFGIASHPWQLAGPDLDTSLDLMQQAGVRWLRLDVYWEEAEPSPGRYRWTTYDRIVAEATARGIRLIAMVPQYDVPRWASPWGRVGGLPTRSSDVERFMHALASHFRGRIPSYEIGNEPNSAKYWLPRVSVTEYLEFLRAAHAGIARGDPDAQVLTGGTANWGSSFVDPLSWQRQLYRAGGGRYFDGVAMHPYSTPLSPDDDSQTFARLSLVRDMRAIMVASGDAAKPIVISEFGWTTTAVRTGRWIGVSEEAQAQYVARGYARILAEFPYVAAACLYTFRDTTDDPLDYDGNFGLVAQDYRAKPAYEAYRRSGAASALRLARAGR